MIRSTRDVLAALALASLAASVGGAQTLHRAIAEYLARRSAGG